MNNTIAYTYYNMVGAGLEKMAAMRKMRSDGQEPPAIGRRFGAYKGEPESRVRGTKAGTDSVASMLEGAYRKTVRLFRGFGFDEDREIEDGVTAVALCYPSIRSISFRKRDIEEFAVRLASGKAGDPHLAGAFLSALARLGRMERLRLHLEALDKPLNGIGTGNRGILEVRGDAGDLLGEGMEDGAIALGGDAGGMAGFRMGMGAIEIGGSAADDAGEAMKGGFLRIRKDAGGLLACEMRGGLVLVEGSAGGKAGMAMKGGTVMVIGDAGDALGAEMEDGLVIVRGGAGDHVGKGMKGGRLVVFGNAGKDIGQGMEGGVIEIYGEAGNLARSFRGGIVYHRGSAIGVK
jgi:formylmethanofuran dehydrogenase subunit C